MAKTKAHPKRNHCCAFCNNWIGDAGLRFVNNSIGYEFEASITAMCPKTNNRRAANYYAGSCSKYEPSMDARKLL